MIVSTDLSVRLQLTNANYYSVHFYTSSTSFKETLSDILQSIILNSAKLFGSLLIIKGYNYSSDFSPNEFYLYIRDLKVGKTITASNKPARSSSYIPQFSKNNLLIF